MNESSRVPVRKIPPKNRGLTGFVATEGRGIAFESSLERDLVVLLSSYPDVVSIEEQPLAVPVPGESGAAATYVPDFLVHRANGWVSLIEVKPSEELKTNCQKYKKRFQAAKDYAHRNGWRFEIWTEKAIRCPRLENAKFLRGYRGDHIEPDLAERILDRVRNESGSPAVWDLVTALGDGLEAQAIMQRALWALIANGRLHVDLERPLTPQSPVRIERGGALGLSQAF